MTEAEVKQWRRDFVVQGPCCLCGGPAHDLHELIAGANRKAAMRERACVLRVCRICHQEVQGRPVEYQLALKLLSDPHGFDVNAFCKAWRRPASAVDFPVLVEYVQHLLSFGEVYAR